MRHGIAHRHAVSVLLIQPTRVELADDCTGAQKRGLETLPFFLGKAHHFKVKGQALILRMERLHAGQRDKNAQTAIVLATVANRVVVRAGQ